MNNTIDNSLEFQRLKELQIERKRFEKMNKTLKTRIFYLENEDEKARKMIEETKKQAKDLILSKNQQFQTQKKFEELRLKQEQDLLEKAEKIKRNKEKARENAEKNKLNARNKKLEQVLLTRKFKEETKIEAFLKKKELQKRIETLKILEKNRGKSLSEQKSRVFFEKSMKNQEEFNEKLDQERVKINKEENLLISLENQEKNMMKSLKNTQFLQKKIYEEFEILE